jgi:hypothetical protein
MIGITVPKRENCTLRVKALSSNHLSPSLFYSTRERLFTLKGQAFIKVVSLRINKDGRIDQFY